MITMSGKSSPANYCAILYPLEYPQDMVCHVHPVNSFTEQAESNQPKAAKLSGAALEEQNLGTVSFSGLETSPGQSRPRY